MTRSRQTADWGSRAGLAKIVPSSVAVGSGTGSADSLGNVTFSGASSVGLRNAFSSSYDNYKIIVNISATSGDALLYLGFGNSGTRDTTSNNNYAYWQRTLTGGDVSTQGAASATLYITDLESYGTASRFANVVIDCFNPFIASETTGTLQSITVSTAGTVFSGAGGFIKGSSTSWADLFILPSANNITGTIRVYGYTQ